MSMQYSILGAWPKNLTSLTKEGVQPILPFPKDTVFTQTINAIITNHFSDLLTKDDKYIYTPYEFY